MVVVNVGGVKLQFIKPVPWAKGNRLFILRNPAPWILTKEASSDDQEKQWIHMALSAHQGRYMRGKIWYTNRKGKRTYLPAPAAVVGLLRRVQIGSTEDKEKLFDAAAEIVAAHVVSVGADNLPLIKDGKYVLKFEGNITAAREILSKLPPCPVLSDAEKQKRKDKTRMTKVGYESKVARWAKLMGKVGEFTPATAPAYPARGGRSAFEDFF